MAPGSGLGPPLLVAADFYKNFLISALSDLYGLVNRLTDSSVPRVHCLPQQAFSGRCSASANQDCFVNEKILFISIHKPPAQSNLYPSKNALAVTVEPSEFSPA